MSATLPGKAGTSGERSMHHRWEERVYRTDRLGSQTDGTAALQVAAALAGYGNADGTNIRPSVPTLASGLGISESTVSRGLDFLTRNGYLETVQRGGRGRATVRRLTLPQQSPVTGDRRSLEQSPVTGDRRSDSSSVISEGSSVISEGSSVTSDVLPAQYIPAQDVPAPSRALEDGGDVEDYSDAPSFETDEDHLAALERITDLTVLKAYHLEHRADFRSSKALLDAARERSRALLHPQR